MINRDLLGGVNSRRVANACMAALNAMQGYRQEEQTIALCLVSMSLANMAEMSLVELQQFAANVASESRPEFKALKLYMENHLQ